MSWLFYSAIIIGNFNLLFPTRLQEHTVETAIAVVADGNATLKIDTQHLRDISFRIGSTYQFIGELLIQPDSEVRVWY